MRSPSYTPMHPLPRETAPALLVLLLAAFAFTDNALAQVGIPPLTGRVMDHANILEPSTEQTLAHVLAAHEDSTTNQIVVLTIPSLEGEAIESFSLRAGREWEIGTGANDNGILLVVAVDERKVRIEVGYGLEGAVPDAVAARIIRHEIVPEFRNGDFDAGVSAGTLAILEAVAGEYDAEDEAGSSELPPIFARLLFAFMFGIFVTVFGFVILMAKSGWRWVGLAFLLPFVFAIGAVVGDSGWIGLMADILYFGGFVYLSRKPAVHNLRERMAEASKKGDTVPVAIGPFTVRVGGSSSGSSGGGFGGFSGGGGGGFSGGGGSFGGGGASGGW